MEVARSRRVLKGVARTWEVGRCGRRGWHDGDRVRVWQNVPARPAIVSFLLAYPHIYALLALRLSPQLLPSHRSFFSPDLPLVPTDGTSSWQPEVEEAAVPRSITRGAVWFARPHRVKKKRGRRTRRSKLRTITIMRRDGLKSGTTEREEIVVDSRGSGLSDETCTEQDRQRNAFLSATRDVTYFFFARYFFRVRFRYRLKRYDIQTYRDVEIYKINFNCLRDLRKKLFCTKYRKHIICV